MAAWACVGEIDEFMGTTRNRKWEQCTTTPPCPLHVISGGTITTSITRVACAAATRSDLPPACSANTAISAAPAADRFPISLLCPQRFIYQIVQHQLMAYFASAIKTRLGNTDCGDAGLGQRKTSAPPAVRDLAPAAPMPKVILTLWQGPKPAALQVSRHGSIPACYRHRRTCPWISVSASDYSPQSPTAFSDGDATFNPKFPGDAEVYLLFCSGKLDVVKLKISFP